MVSHLQGIQPTKGVMAVTAKQTTVNFSTIISIWLSHINVLSIIIPKHVTLVVMDLVLLSEPNLMGICELLLVKNCMRLMVYQVGNKHNCYFTTGVIFY